jgi:AcrR family transcriptional regulator
VARREILDATATLLGKGEFADLTVESVMALAGMHRSSFYHYFSDLSDALLQLMDIAQAELLAAAEPYITGESQGPDGLSSAIRGSAEAWVRHRDVLLAVQDGGVHPRLTQRYRAIVEEWSRVTADQLRAERRAGRTAVKRPDDIAAALTLMNINVFAERLGRAGDSPAAVARTLSQIWINAIYPDAPPRREIRGSP